MTDQEIEKLREKLGSEYSVKRLNGAITVELVDIWKGVEFAECVEYHKGSRTGKEIFQGHIYKINDWFKRELVYFDGFEYGWPVLFFKPSTESAYLEQLKAKARELYGSIKDGDRFWIDENIGEVSMYDCEDGFSYWKEEDLLYFGNYAIYSKGKWAKRVHEPIKVEGAWNEYNDDHLTVRFKFEYKGSHPNPVELSAHLAKCLEDYLNKSQ